MGALKETPRMFGLWKSAAIASAFCICVAVCAHQRADAGPTDTLPKPSTSGFAPVNGVRLWYGEYGAGRPVILLHGGITSSVSWSHQIPALSARYRVIAIDSRGHGRSSRTNAPFTYELLAADVLEVMDYLHVRKAAVVGWSDGADVGLLLAIHHPERVSRLFAGGGNTDRAALKDSAITPAMRAFFMRSAQQYRAISPTPSGFAELVEADGKLAALGPHISARDLRSIRVPTWIVDADHDQFIKRENTDFQAREIPGAAELILPGVTHGALEEDPALVNAALLDFLSRRF